MPDPFPVEREGGGISSFIGFAPHRGAFASYIFSLVKDKDKSNKSNYNLTYVRCWLCSNMMNHGTSGVDHGSPVGPLNREPSDEAGDTGIAISSKHWTIVQGWIPIGDETASLLNVSGQKAHVEITVYYSHRDPAGPYCITVPEGRTEHVHLNRLTDPEAIPRETNYESTIESDVPIVVKHPKAWETRHYREKRISEGHFLSHYGPNE